MMTFDELARGWEAAAENLDGTSAEESARMLRICAAQLREVADQQREPTVDEIGASLACVQPDQS